MKRILCYLFLLFAVCPFTINAQHIFGRVVDADDQPVDAAVVVWQTLDSAFVEAVITDSLGLFSFAGESEGAFRLIFQHLMYETLEKEYAASEVGAVRLSLKEMMLEEVVVKGERPVVRVEGSALSYDVPQLIKDKASVNAFEAIKELPGVMGDDETIELIGARSLQVVINGQVTSLTLPQLVQYLKSIPASRVQKAEVMYNAPARYNVKGAVINVVLDAVASEEPLFQGEVGANYRQMHYGSAGVNANLLYATSRWHIDFLVDGTSGRSYSGEDIEARHTMNNEVTHIDQWGRGKNEGMRGSARLAVDYTFANKDKLSAVYYMNGSDIESTREATTIFTPSGGEKGKPYTSDAYTSGNAGLHNAALQFEGHKGFRAGADYTRYKDPSDMYFNDRGDGEEVRMRNNSRQDVSRYSLYMNQAHRLGKWSLNYGAQGGYTRSDNFMEYAYDTGNGYEPRPDLLEDNRQQDYTGNVFVETSTQLGPRLSLSAALKGDYYRSDYKSLKEDVNLWNEWTLLPTLSMSYTITPYHILQLNVTSDKSYPSYWNLSPKVFPLNSYSEVVGNPLLKPYRSYNSQLLYILKQKYIFMAFCTYEPDYFTQVPYQSDSEMKNVFRYENFDFGLKTGLVAIIPFRVGEWWSSRVTLQGFRMQEKMKNFHSMSFDRHSLVGAFVMSNTFSLPRFPRLKLTLDGQYVTPGAIQGIYDLGYVYKIDAALKYVFAKEKATLTLTGTDIFASGYPNRIEINQGNQWSRMVKVNDVQAVRLAFSYKFGGYQKKEHKQVDTSRFGK
ncbi:TonB-dependent receptor [Parabacteroides sp. OttesenSCG-928-K15]|nr:TonB-dependent receptor [Parabacteroides sp. OttesenSCG-928-K15]